MGPCDLISVSDSKTLEDTPNKLWAGTWEAF